MRWSITHTPPAPNCCSGHQAARHCVAPATAPRTAHASSTSTAAMAAAIAASSSGRHCHGPEHGHPHPHPAVACAAANGVAGGGSTGGASPDLQPRPQAKRPQRANADALPHGRRTAGAGGRPTTGSPVGGSSGKGGRDAGYARGHQQPPPAARQAQQQRGGRSAVQQYDNRNAAARREYDRAYDDDDEEGEDEEEDQGELLGLSEEELERIVFASAAVATGAATGGGRDVGVASSSGGEAQSGDGTDGQDESSGSQGRREQHPQQRQQKQRKQAAPAAPRLSVAEAIAAAGLPSELQTLLLQAHEAGTIGNDGEILSQQLQALLAEAAGTVPPGPAGTASSSADAGTLASTGTACNDAVGGEAVLAGVHRVAGYLDCAPAVAAVIVVNYPRLLRLSEGQAEGQLRYLAFELKWKVAEAQEAARRNPALMLVPPELLGRKLKALSNATGLTMAQAASMVTTYMFPGL